MHYLNSSYQKQLLTFIVEELLGLVSARTPAKIARRSSHGNQVFMVGVSQSGARYSLALYVVDPQRSHPNVAVTIDHLDAPRGSRVPTDYLDFMLTETTLERGMLSNKPWSINLPFPLPKELRRAGMAGNDAQQQVQGPTSPPSAEPRP